ncbi:MAG: TMEM165/GDT1 family protein [Pseudobdellovibrionaceae bacterium]
MESIFNSFLLVAASEMGDKTQLLAFVLASRFRKPWAIVAGILVATIFNHLLAAWVGSWVSSFVDPQILKYALAFLFVVFGLWILKPDQQDENLPVGHWGAFLTTTVAFFLAEMGDKTQLATLALGARYQDLFSVTFGSTMGMMFADGLAVFFGDRMSHRIPMKAVRIFACLLFLVFALFILLGNFSPEIK